jgi:hypothetical protein
MAEPVQGVPGRDRFRTTLPGIPADTSNPLIERLSQINRAINVTTGRLAELAVAGPHPVATGLQAARMTGERLNIPVLGGIPSGPEAREFAEVRGPIGLLEEERRVTGKVTEPVGRFLGRGIAQDIPGVQVAEAARRAGAPIPNIPAIGEKIGGVGFPEVALLSNLIPIPIIDDALRIAIKLAPDLKAGVRVAPEVLRGIRDEVARFVGDPALGNNARRTLNDLGRLLGSERGALGPGDIRPVERVAAEVPEAARPAERVKTLNGPDYLLPDFTPLTQDAAGNIVGQTTLYHGATEAGARGIIERGFRPEDKVWLTGSPREAQRFAGGVQGVVLRVELRSGAVGTGAGRFSPTDIVGVSRTAPVEAGAPSAVGPGAAPPPPDLSSVADAAEDAATRNLPPVAGAERIGVPSPRILKTVAEIAEDTRRSTQNAFGALARGVARFPPMRSIVDFVNPSSLIDRPPAKLVDELGEEGASQLQARLIAHARKLDQGNAIASAIEEGVQQRARAVGLEVQDGLVVSIEGSPPVGDLFENPSRYTLTPEQRTLVDEVQAVLNDMNAAERAAGVKKGQIFSEEGRYFPRLVREVRGVENVRAQVRRIVGAKQGFTKDRFYATMQDGIDAGVRYEDDISAIVGTRIRAGMKAAGDEELALLIRPLGRTLKAPRRAVGIGEMGTMVPALGGRAFPPETARVVMDALNPAPPGSTLRFLDGLNNVLRPIQATGELSFWGIQMMGSIFRNPIAFARGALYSLDGLLLDGRLYGRYIQNNADWINRFIGANGTWNASEFTFEQAVRNKTIRNVFSKLGLEGALGRFDQAFNQGLNVTGLENFKGMVGLGDSVGFDKFNRAIRAGLGDFAGGTVDEVAASIASKMTGRLPVRGLGVKATQRSVESSLAFASRYYRAMFGLLGDALQGGMRGAEARRVLGSLFAGAIVLHVAAARALGQEPNLDPRKSNWLTVRIGGVNVGVGGPIYGLGRMLAESVENPDKLTSLNMNNPLVRWARGRTAPVLSLATDLVTQRTFLGKKIDSAGDLFREIATTPLPFIAQQTIEEGPAGFAPQFFGLRSFPASRFERLEDARQEVMRERGIDGSFDDLQRRDPIEAARIDADPRVKRTQEALAEQEPRTERGEGFQRLAQLREEQAVVQTADDEALLAGTLPGDRWRRQRSGREREFFAKREEAEQNFGIEFPEFEAGEDAVRNATEAYFAVEYDSFVNSETGEVDNLGFDRAQDAALAPLSEQDRLDFERLILGRHDTPVELRFRTGARRLRDELADVPQFIGLSTRQHDQVREFNRAVQAQRNTWRADPSVGEIALGEAEEFLSERWNQPEWVVAWSRALRSSRDREENRNPAYFQFLVANQGELQLFYPELYRGPVLDFVREAVPAR